VEAQNGPGTYVKMLSASRPAGTQAGERTDWAEQVGDGENEQVD
jgi:hypothetical protein